MLPPCDHDDCPIAHCVHPVPTNPYGIFAMHSQDNKPFSQEETKKLIAGPIAAAEPMLKAEMDKPLLLTPEETARRIVKRFGHGLKVLAD